MTTAITDLVVLSADHEIETPVGFVKIPLDLNLGAGGDYIYLCYRRGNGDPITGIQVLVNTNNPPPGYTLLPNDLNRNARGAYLYLCYTKDPARGTDPSGLRRPIVDLAVQTWKGDSAWQPPPVDFSGTAYDRIDVDLNKGRSDAPYIYLSALYGQPSTVPGLENGITQEMVNSFKNDPHYQGYEVARAQVAADRMLVLRVRLSRDYETTFSGALGLDTTFESSEGVEVTEAASVVTEWNAKLSSKLSLGGLVEFSGEVNFKLGTTLTNTYMTTESKKVTKHLAYPKDAGAGAGVLYDVLSCTLIDELAVYTMFGQQVSAAASGRLVHGDFLAVVGGAKPLSFAPFRPPPMTPRTLNTHLTVVGGDGNIHFGQNGTFIVTASDSETGQPANGDVLWSLPSGVGMQAFGTTGQQLTRTLGYSVRVPQKGVDGKLVFVNKDEIEQLWVRAEGYALARVSYEMSRGLVAIRPRPHPSPGVLGSDLVAH